MSKKAVLLLSGGADSTTILYYIKNTLQYNDIYALSFNYGQRYLELELNCADYHCKKLNITEHKIFDVRFLNEIVKTSSITNLELKVPQVKDILGHPQPSCYYPQRNLIFLSIATSWAESVGANVVFYGASQVDSPAGYYDCTESFVNKLTELLSLNRVHKIKIEAPLLFKSKKEIFELGISLNVPYEKTHTCYDPVYIYGKNSNIEKVLACGKCVACSSRIKAWIDIGKLDPLEYNIIYHVT
jgi:7-cyano-7-deazaguanine synthase